MVKRWRRVCTVGLLVVLVTTAQGAFVEPDGTLDVNGVLIAFHRQGSIVPPPNLGHSNIATLTYVGDNSTYDATSTTVIPEPTTVALLGLGALLALNKRKR